MSIPFASDHTVEEKLKALFKLQQIDSAIDKIKQVRGELPLEVQDLEDELEGIQTRINKLKAETDALEQAIADRKNAIKEALSQIKKYEEQQNNVRNNREFESLSKEIEYQTLDIQLSEKKIKEFKAQIEAKNVEIEANQATYADRKIDLDQKKAELNDIVAETEKEESQLLSMSTEAAEKIEERVLVAYRKIRNNTVNGLAVVPIRRDSCGGCFNTIPPQRQLDIKMHKKIIVCEYCGRILVDAEFAENNQLVLEI